MTNRLVRSFAILVLAGAVAATGCTAAGRRSGRRPVSGPPAAAATPATAAPARAPAPGAAPVAPAADPPSYPAPIVPEFTRRPAERAIPAHLIAISEAKDIVIFTAPGTALRPGAIAWLDFGKNIRIRVRVGQPIGDPKNRKFTGAVLPAEPPCDPPPAPSVPAYDGPEVAKVPPRR